MRREHIRCLFFHHYTWSRVFRILSGCAGTSVRYFFAHLWSLMEAVAQIYVYEIAHGNCKAKEDWIKCHDSWFHESNSVHFNLICFEVPWLFSFFSCLIHMQAVACLYLHRIVRDTCKAQEDWVMRQASNFYVFCHGFFHFPHDSSICRRCCICIYMGSHTTRHLHSVRKLDYVPWLVFLCAMNVLFNFSHEHPYAGIGVFVLMYDGFHGNCNNRIIHQIEKLRFLGYSRYKFKLRFWLNLNLYRGIWVSGYLVDFGGAVFSVETVIRDRSPYVHGKEDVILCCDSSVQWLNLYFTLLIHVQGVVCLYLYGIARATCKAEEDWMWDRVMEK